MGPHCYSVVSAVYNVGLYLEDYLNSLVVQTLDFKTHIQLILVDDGSTDNSRRIIRRWLKKYPGNIQYYRIPNSGPAAARNVGLSHATCNWVTFIDPDDFVDREYFARVDATIEKNREGTVGLVSCAFVFYNEVTRQTLDGHPLRFRFAAGEVERPIRDLGRFVQLNVNSAFFRRDIIEAAGLRFDERVRPVFEDAHFCGRYLLRAQDSLAVFAPGAVYYYRRRSDGTSLLQTAPGRPEMYADKVRYGYIGLLREAAQLCGTPPRHIQFTVLYSLGWDLARIVDNAGPMPILSQAQEDEYVALLKETFAFIEVEAVVGYDVYGMPLAHRIGLLNLFKAAPPPTPIIEAAEYDSALRLLRLVHPSHDRKPPISFEVDGIETQPLYRKARRSDFLGHVFLWENISWVPAKSAASIRVVVGGAEARIIVRGREMKVPASVSAISASLGPRALPAPLMPNSVREIRRRALLPESRQTFRNAWLFMDRDSVADDSAEYLYRHVRESLPGTNAWFIIRRDTPDWDRLASDGFRLIPFNEPAHAIALMNARHFISSQADHYVLGYLDDRHFGDLLNYRFTFLQHGVSRDDISGWLNPLGIDRLVTSTRQEYESIVGDGSPYRFTERECVLSGLPRHDALLSARTGPDNTIVIMPTWRSSLTGSAKGAGNERSASPKFFDSEFARRWKELLHAPRLAELARELMHRIVFVPHPNIEQYLAHFDLPKAIEIRRFGEKEPIQGLFRSLSALVTDYSSKAFDAALLGKPVVYYQFDRERFFRGEHISRPGYFHYETDGFGPVCIEQHELLGALERMLRNGRPDGIYRERAERTLVFRDGKNCERVVDAILAMERSAGARLKAAPVGIVSASAFGAAPRPLRNCLLLSEPAEIDVDGRGNRQAQRAIFCIDNSVVARAAHFAFAYQQLCEGRQLPANKLTVLPQYFRGADIRVVDRQIRAGVEQSAGQIDMWTLAQIIAADLEGQTYQQDIGT